MTKTERLNRKQLYKDMQFFGFIPKGANGYKRAILYRKGRTDRNFKY